LIALNYLFNFPFYIIRFEQMGVPVLLNDPVVVALAAEIGKTPAQVLLLPNRLLSYFRALSSYILYLSS